LVNPPHIALLLTALGQFNAVASAQNDAHRLQVQCGTKSVVVVWPHNLGEVFFDFLQDGKLLFAESVEYYEREPSPHQAKEVAQVVSNFFQYEAKLTTVGSVLKRTELQSFRGGEWRSVLQWAAQ
jgi:hypothetical protein